MNLPRSSPAWRTRALYCLPEIEPLAFGIADWHAELEPAGDSTVVFRDCAFANDVAKTSLTAILEQRGLGSVRSL